MARGMGHNALQLQPVSAPKSGLRDTAFQGLTHRQLAYCEARMAGHNMSQAYRIAYDCSGSSDQTVGRHAYDVENNGKVQAKLRQLLAERSPNTSLLPPITKDFVLTGIATLAVTADKQTVQLRAYELLGKAVGLFERDTEEVLAEPSTSADVDAEIKRRLRAVLAPEIEGEVRRVETQPAPPSPRNRQRKPRGVEPPPKA